MGTVRTFRVVFLTLLVSTALLLASIAFADNPSQGPYDTCQTSTGFVPLECFQGSRKLAEAYNTPELGPFMNRVFVGAIALGAIIAVLRLAWAGFVYMASDLWTSKEKAREIIKDTMLGLFLLLAIYLILKQINPDILTLKIDTSGKSSSGPASSDYSGFTADETQRSPQVDPFSERFNVPQSSNPTGISPTEFYNRVYFPNDPNN